MNLFVAKLSSSTTSDDLREVFGRFGEVNRANVVLDRDTGESRGFGFVEMRDAEAGRAALEALNGFTLNGRAMVVKEAEDRRSDRPSGPPRDRPGGPPRDRPGGPPRDRPSGPPRDREGAPSREGADRPFRPAGPPVPPSTDDDAERRDRFRGKDKPKKEAERKPKKPTLKPQKGKKAPKKGRWVDDFDDDF
jgi:RNA recognition motif-containing protein